MLITYRTYILIAVVVGAIIVAGLSIVLVPRYIEGARLNYCEEVYDSYLNGTLSTQLNAEEQKCMKDYE